MLPTLGALRGVQLPRWGQKLPWPGSWEARMTTWAPERSERSWTPGHASCNRHQPCPAPAASRARLHRATRARRGGRCSPQGAAGQGPSPRQARSRGSPNEFHMQWMPPRGNGKGLGRRRGPARGLETCVLEEEAGGRQGGGRAEETGAEEGKTLSSEVLVPSHHLTPREVGCQAPSPC